MLHPRNLLTTIRRLLACLALIACADQVRTASAQVTPGMPYSGSLQTYVQGWTVDENDREETVGQFVVPVGLYLPVADGIDVRLSTAYVSLTRTPEGGSSETVSGASDLKVQASAALLNRRLMVGTILNLPTGKRSLSGAQQDVVLAFVAPDLSVRANRFGEGLNLGGTVSYAVRASAFSVLGLAAAFVTRGPYTTTFPGSDASLEFNPGFEATLTAAWLYTTTINQLRVAASFTRHGTEQANDVDIFRLGSRIALDATLTRPIDDGRGTLTVGAQELYRFKNTSGLSGDFDTEQLNTNGNYLILLAALDYTLMDPFSLALNGATRLISENEQGVGDARLFEGGLDVSYQATSLITLGIGGRLVVGSGTALNGADRSIRGVEGLARLIFHY